MKDVTNNIRFLLRSLRPYWGASCFLIALGIVSVCLSLQIIAQSKQAFDIASGSADGDLTGCLLWLAGLFAVSVTVSTATSWLNVRFQLRVNNELTARVFRHILRAEWLPAQRYHSGDVMSRVNTDIHDWVQLVSVTIPQFVITLAKLCSAFVFLFLLDRMLALMLALLIPLVLLLSKLYFQKMRKLSLEMKRTLSSVRQFFQESVQRQGVVKALHLVPWFESRLGDRQEEYADRVRRHNRLSVSSRWIMSAGFTAGFFLSLTWGLFRLQSGEISFGTMTAFLQLVSMIQGPAAGLMGYVPAFIAAYTATERLKELWALPPEGAGEAVTLEKIDNVRLENVTFSYQPEKPVIKGRTLEFRKGMTALTGETGCGKTTVVRLILGLVQPQTGKVVMTDSTGRHEMYSALRCNLAYVPQGGLLFSGTVRDNLRMGNPKATDEEMTRVLQSVSADFVWKKRNGLDTLIREDGQGFSGGQIQRIAIARALLSGGQVLLLDEATSALDEKTETDIIRSIRENVNDRIVIIVSHRRSVIESCDKVYRFD